MGGGAEGEGEGGGGEGGEAHTDKTNTRVMRGADLGYLTDPRPARLREITLPRLTFVARLAVAAVAVHLVHARPVVLTRPRGALVDVHAALGALETGHAEALVAVGSVFTDGSVVAGLGPALVHVLLAVCPLVPRGAEALAAVRSLPACGAVEARLLRAVPGRSPAVLPRVAPGTVTGVGVHAVHAAGADAVAGAALAFVHVQVLAVVACVPVGSCGAQARVGPHGLQTGASIVTGG